MTFFKFWRGLQCCFERGKERAAFKGTSFLQLVRIHGRWLSVGSLMRGTLHCHASVSY